MTDWSSLSLANAAGFIKGPCSQFDNLLRAPVQTITIGSITLLERPGNAGTTYAESPFGTSVNALGLPNPGLANTLEFAWKLRDQAFAADKDLNWSVAGFSTPEYVCLACDLEDYGMVELNLGCPNVWMGPNQKHIAAFEPLMIDDILTQVKEKVRNNFTIKVSPYSDPRMVETVAQLARKHQVAGIVTSNTFPNGLIFENGRKRALDVEYGGVGGTALREIALGQVAQFKKALQGSGIPVTGVGGVVTGADLAAMREAGADHVQVGTAFGKYGASIFSSILSEAAELAE
jgi:dihydroorotate dehydrogenase (fumarate)